MLFFRFASGPSARRDYYKHKETYSEVRHDEEYGFKISARGIKYEYSI